METEKAMRKFQDSIVAPNKKLFKVSHPTQKTMGFKSVPWWTGGITIMRKKINAFEGDISEPYRTANCVKPGNSNTCRRKGSTKPL